VLTLVLTRGDEASLLWQLLYPQLACLLLRWCL